MYAVIFRAKIDQLDDVYLKTASKMRELAISKYGCTEFTAVTEGNLEIAISYWQNQEDIVRWKQDLKHLAAQKLGRSKWYRSYQVQVVKIIREYEHHSK